MSHELINLFFGTNFLFNQRRIEGEKYNIGMHRKKPTNSKKIL
jgi:hypothetical protein